MLKLTDIASPFSGRQTEDVCIEDCFFFFDCHGGLLVLQCYSKLSQQQAQLVAVRPAVEPSLQDSRDIQLCQQPQRTYMLTSEFRRELLSKGLLQLHTTSSAPDYLYYETDI